MRTPALFVMLLLVFIATATAGNDETKPEGGPDTPDNKSTPGQELETEKPKETGPKDKPSDKDSSKLPPVDKGPRETPRPENSDGGVDSNGGTEVEEPAGGDGGAEGVPEGPEEAAAVTSASKIVGGLLGVAAVLTYLF